MRVAGYAVLGAVLVSGCATTPPGPMVQVIPGPGRSFDQFQYDDARCRSFAGGQVSGQAEGSNQRAVGGAVLSTVLGAGLGAIVGGGRGAAVGAVTGGGIGVGLGAGSSAGTQGGIQAQYDGAYAQCMYARGNVVPAFEPPPGYAVVAMPAVGRSGSLVGAIQAELGARGYLQGPPDGVAGPQTVRAIQQFEASHGLPVDGVPSEFLLDQIRSAPSGY